MAERYTLADFARRLGIPPVTARSWKHRGRIVEDEGGGYFWLRCSTCEQLYCGEGDSCHAWCSEECANGRDCKCVACARVAARPAPQYERSSSGASPEQIAEARQRFEARKARPATCDGCADLALYVGAAQADIESLVAENTGLRDRIA